MPKRPKNLKGSKCAKNTIVATSQVSRFHSETLETLFNNVDLKQVNISVGDRDLIVDTDLQLFAGIHYGLVGGNGTGKTTLLKCIGNKIITGFPSNIRSLYVEQLVSGLELELTVIEAVINSDKERTNLVRCAKALEEALGSGDDTEIAQCFHKIQLDNQKREFEDAQKTAMERSGARGAVARKILNNKEDELRQIEKLALEEPNGSHKIKLVEMVQDLLNE